MSSRAQRVIYAGLEATPGTAVPVDIALLATAELKAVVDKRVVQEDTGFAPRRHYIGSKHAEGTLTTELTYQQAPIFVSMAMGANTGVVGTSPSLWDFLLPIGTTAPTFKTYTVEYSDGDDHIVASDDVFATEMEISGEAGGAWQLKNTLTGADVTFPAAVSASPTPPATPRTVLMAETTLKFADDGLLDAATPVGVLISFTYKLTNLQHSKLFAGSLFPTSRGHDRWEATLEVLVESTHTEVEIRKDMLFNTSQTCIRIGADAPDAGGEAIDWKVNIDGAYFLQDVATLSERDGNNTLALTFVGELPVDAVIDPVIHIENDLAAL